MNPVVLFSLIIFCVTVQVWLVLIALSGLIPPANTLNVSHGLSGSIMCVPKGMRCYSTVLWDWPCWPRPLAFGRCGIN